MTHANLERSDFIVMNGGHLTVCPRLSSLLIDLKRRVDRQHVNQLPKQLPITTITSSSSSSIIVLSARQCRQTRPDQHVGVVDHRVEETPRQQLRLEVYQQLDETLAVTHFVFNGIAYRQQIRQKLAMLTWKPKKLERLVYLDNLLRGGLVV